VASVLGTFGLTNRQLDGDHKLPEALTVFGSLKVSSISIFHGDEDEGSSSYTVQPVAQWPKWRRPQASRKTARATCARSGWHRRSQRAAARHRPARLHSWGRP
jgi:hypothetical protein